MYSSRFVHTGLLVFVAVLTPSSLALGQPPSGAPRAQQSSLDTAAKTADQYVSEAKAFVKSGDDPQAYEAYQAAWKLKRSVDIAGNLGLVELRLGKARDAAEHLAYCEQNFPAIRDDDKEKKLIDLRRALESARAQVGLARIRVTPHDGVSAQGADILVDGQVIGRASANGKLVHPLLQSSDVFVDAGSRTFTARIPGCAEGRAVMSVAKGSDVDVVLSPCKRSLSVPLIVTGSSVAAAGLGLGIGSAILMDANSREADTTSAALATRNNRRACAATPTPSECTQLDEAHAASQTFRTLAIGGFVVGGAALAATVIYGVTGRSQPPPGPPPDVKVQASFLAAPGGGAAVLRGTF